MCLILSTSHSFVHGLRRSLTFDNRVVFGGGPIDASGSDVDNQGSVYTPTSSPDPRAQPSPLVRRSLSTNSPRHP